MPDKTASNTVVHVGPYECGDGKPCLVIAEVGINHNGSLELAKKLIDAAVDAGAHAVKFQKRTVPVVYSEEELQKPRELADEIIFAALKRGVLPPENVERLTASGYQDTTNGDLKWALELTEKEYAEIDRYCSEKGVLWLASPWDEASVDFIEAFDPPAYKIASASLTDDALIQLIRSKGRPIFLSTGMSTLEEIDHAVEVLGKDDLILMHCVSTYPAEVDDVNLAVIHTLKERYGIPIAYSGHEKGVYTSLCAAVMGAVAVERHITLDRTMWGSDQAASLEPHGLQLLTKELKNYDRAKGDGIKRVLEAEEPILKKLRRKNTAAA